ncbi:very short patch repair endonuclease [Terriglobus sp. RCC_193]|uniref:very short patch repair endonuclease n=1 Tax=Terriglobus sp. RCC_193 TaxID=3239218 RepID=UPI0035249225
MDSLDARRRSENMRRIRSKNSKPEIFLRSLLHKAGYRFRLHRTDLPGKPDVVFPGRRKVIFVHGCFWHQHSGCREGRLPGTRPEYWVPKLQRNVARDLANSVSLEKLGWRMLIIWECEIESSPGLLSKVEDFLGR